MKQKLIKQFENGTDFSICVIDMQNGTYVVTEYDFVNKKHELKGKYNDKNQALMAAKEINKSFKVLNESQLRKIIKENVKKVLKEMVADDGYSFDGLEDYEAQQEYYSNNYSIDYVINNLKQIGFDIPTINGEFPYNIINTVKTLLELIGSAEKEEINKGKMYEILHNYTLKYMENYQKQCQKVIQDFNYLDYRLEKLCNKYPLTQEDIEQQKRDFDV